MTPVTRREILAMALPAAASAVLNNAFRIIDQYAAGGIGTNAQAAIGSCTFVFIAIFYLWELVAAGAGPVLARHIGAADLDGARKVAGNALTGALLVGAVVAAVVGTGAPVVATLLGLQGEVAADAVVFLRTLVTFGLLSALGPTLDAAFVAMGQTRTMMVLQVLAAVLNAALNPFFIHQLGWGVAGAAVATAIARSTATVLGLGLLRARLGLRLVDLRLDQNLRRIVRVGLPVSANGLFYAGVYFAILRTTISPLGPVENAALGIGFSALEGFAYPWFLGLSLGVAGIVGRRLGACEPDEARRAVRLALPMAAAAGVAALLLFRLGGPVLCGLFTTDPAVLAAALVYANALAWSQPFVALEALAEGVLQGAGNTRPIMAISAPANLLRVPLGWALAFPAGWGALGVWWAINLTSVVKALGKGVIVARGEWVRTKV